MQKSDYISNNIGNKKGAAELPWTGFYCNPSEPVFWIKSGKRTFRCGSLELSLTSLASGQAEIGKVFFPTVVIVCV